MLLKVIYETYVKLLGVERFTIEFKSLEDFGLWCMSLGHRGYYVKIIEVVYYE